MALLKDTCDKESRGQIEKTVVVKQYADGRTVVTAFPDMSNIKPSEQQKICRMSFKEAQAYAVEFLKDPFNKAAYKALCAPGQKPHNVLISQLLKKERPDMKPIPTGPVIAFGNPR